MSTIDLAKCRADLATTKLAIAAREAEVLALREALKTLRGVAFHRSNCPAFPPGAVMESCSCGYDEAEDDTHALLAAPTSTEALREFGLAVVRRTHTAARHMPDAAIVDAVLAGKP